ncbi:MAG: hypothetical protein MZV70_33170 [Desulfobacterales bacterium]|nr:hypothetical protein [Desulfobacterales bacterium]
MARDNPVDQARTSGKPTPDRVRRLRLCALRHDAAHSRQAAQNPSGPVERGVRSRRARKKSWPRGSASAPSRCRCFSTARAKRCSVTRAFSPKPR